MRLGIRILAACVAVVVIFVTRSHRSTPADGPPGATAAEAPAASAAPGEIDYTARLESYSGHGEWVKYNAPDGAEITGYIAFPERPDPAPAMIVIHEIFGMSDFVRTVTHDLAAAGYVALAPDLLSRVGGTQGADDARGKIGDLDPNEITVDLNATMAYLRSLPSVRATGMGVIGFCWGGSQSFRYATNQPDLDAAVVCYGGAPPAEEMARIDAPVLGVYAENDARISAALPEVEQQMRAAGKPFEYEIYKGANHGFIRSRNVPEEADRAWRNILAFLGAHLDGSDNN